MPARSQAIQELAAKALADKVVDVVLGYSPGSLPMRMQPFAARCPESAAKLRWNSFCVNDLARQLLRLCQKQRGRFGIVAQGCITRNLVVLIKEAQLDRDRLFVIGVPCQQMLDRRKIEACFGAEAILQVIESAHEISVVTLSGQVTLPRQQFVRENCLQCGYPNPVFADEPCAPSVPLPAEMKETLVPGLGDLLSSDERLAAFEAAYDGCLLCHACESVCSLCDASGAQPFESPLQSNWHGSLFNEIASYHILRAYQLAGRCTDCGACDSACPKAIRLRQLTMRINQDVYSTFGHTAGLRLDDPMPLFLDRPAPDEIFLG